MESFNPAAHGDAAGTFWRWLTGETEEPARRAAAGAAAGTFGRGLTGEREDPPGRRNRGRGAPPPRGPFLGPAADRLYRNARLAFASGVAAGYLRHVHEDAGHPDALLR